MLHSETEVELAETATMVLSPAVAVDESPSLNEAAATAVTSAEAAIRHKLEVFLGGVPIGKPGAEGSTSERGFDCSPMVEFAMEHGGGAELVGESAEEIYGRYVEWKVRQGEEDARATPLGEQGGPKSAEQFAGELQIQYGHSGKGNRHKKPFELVWANLSNQQLEFRAHKGDTIATRAVNLAAGCMISTPKSARKGHPYVFRLDLSEADDHGDEKYATAPCGRYIVTQ